MTRPHFQEGNLLYTNIEQALTRQVKSTYLDRVTFTRQITLAEDLIKTAQEVLSLAKQR